MNPRLVARLRARASIVDGEDVVSIVSPGGTVTFRSLSPSTMEAFRLLRDGAPEGELARIVAADLADTALERWYYYLASIERRGELTYNVRHDGRWLARTVVMSPFFRPGSGEVDQSDRWVVSRFAYLRRRDYLFLLESPLSCARVELLDPLSFDMLAALAVPRTASDLAASVGDGQGETAHAFLALLQYAGMLTRADSTGRTFEDDDTSLRTWNFADFLFHARSRAGRHDESFERFRFLGELAPLPAVKAPMSDHIIDLYVPDIADLSARDVRFTRVLEERRSLRSYDARPLTVDQLAEFLYRAARVRHLIEADGQQILYQASSRPYPGGGACYELELYIVVGRCDGLPVGLYHYNPLDHRLEVIPGGEAYVADFLRDVPTPLENAEPRQVLIIFAARFQRVTWKYNSSTYAAIMKNVGVLYQTMYLVATAMDLAPCALGGGNSELFAKAVGLPFHEETSVGEFTLGSRPRDNAAGLPGA